MSTPSDSGSDTEPSKEPSCSDVLESENHKSNLLLRQKLDLFRQKSDYLNFAGNFEHSRLVAHLLNRQFALENETLHEFVRVAIESCQRIQDALKLENRLDIVGELVVQSEKTLLIIAGIILQVLKKENDEKRDENKERLSKEILQDLWMNIPAVVSPVTGFRVPLPHILFHFQHSISCTLLQNCIRYRHDLIKMFIDGGYDLNQTDSFGNTILHAMISSWFSDYVMFRKSLDLDGNECLPLCAKTTQDIIELLLDNGVYQHARNKMGQTAKDLLFGSIYEMCSFKTHVMELLQKYDVFPALQHIVAMKIVKSKLPYHDKLPDSIVRFVNLH